jgi:asparagine synthase (glutamine-hydrolysing)
LGHTRLSILDLSSAANQPMVDPTGRYHITYNGEVYNFAELKRELASGGWSFETTSDTEVVLAAFSRWREAAFARLNGMFAIAIWDTQEDRLWLARDRFGIKPLYYRADPSGITFGSEPKTILASGSGDPLADPQALAEYMWYGFPLGAQSLFSGISQLLPGHWMSWQRGTISIQPFWSPENVAPVNVSEDDAIIGVRDLLEAATQRHLQSDVPVGLLLSGGVDSSALAAFASRHYPGRLSTYSVGFDFDRGVNELPKARRVAEAFGTEHHELRISGGDLVGVVESLVRFHDEPFADAANIPLFLICAQLKGSPKVVLQGDGGDEMFGGYRRYRSLAKRGPWRTARALAKALRVLPPQPRLDRALRFALAMGEPDEGLRMAYLLTQEPSWSEPTSLLAPEIRQVTKSHDPFKRYREMARRFGYLDPVQRMLYTDTSVLLPGQFLPKVDRSTMAWGVEVRVPMLDTELSSFAMGLPAGLKVRDGQGKWVLKKALEGIVPSEVLYGPKTGFGVPYSFWLRGPLANFMRGVLLDPTTTAASWLDRVNVHRTVEAHIAGKVDAGFILWKTLHLALWTNAYGVRGLGGASVQY